MIAAFLGLSLATAFAAEPGRLPKPDTDHKVKNFAKVLGWPKDKTPKAPEGFVVTKYADDFKNPRMIYAAPNGDLFVVESQTEHPKTTEKIGMKIVGADKAGNVTEKDSANRIIILRDANKDGKPELRKTFLSDLSQPFGMAIVGDSFYVANTDGLMKFPYKEGDTKISAKGKQIHDLPAGGYNNHWTRNIIASLDQKKIYIAVGSASGTSFHKIT